MGQSCAELFIIKYRLEQNSWLLIHKIKFTYFLLRWATKASRF